MKRNLLTMLFVSVLAAILTSGCVTAHVNYSLSGVETVRQSPYSRSSLFVEKFKDSRYKDKKSVSYYVKKHGSYATYHAQDSEDGVGIRPTPEMTDYREIFRGVPYSKDNSYYSAPDRLYWVPNGPLTETREMLAKHISATGTFRSVTTDDSAKADFTLKLDAKRFLALKERRPVIDVIDILFTGFLFSSDEIVSGDVEWQLVRNADGKVIDSGTASYGSVENHHVFRSRMKPFKLNNTIAKNIAERIISDMAR